MITQIRKYAQEHQLTIDAKSNLAYGNYNGQLIGIWETNSNHPLGGKPAGRVAMIAHAVKIWAKANEMTTLETIQNYLRQLPGKVEFLQNITYDGKCIMAFFVGGGAGWGKRYAPAIDSFLRDVTNLCASYIVEAGCEFCGTEQELSLYQLNMVPHLICPACICGVDQQTEQNKAQYKAQGQGNVFLGIIGAFLGALLGVVLWVVIYQVGFISMLGALALAVSAFKGYERLGGHMTKLGIGICCVVSLIMLMFAEHICIALSLYEAFAVSDGISFFDAFIAVPFMLFEPEVLKAVLPDVLIGVLFVAIASIERGVQVYKMQTGAVATRMIARISGNSGVVGN